MDRFTLLVIHGNSGEEALKHVKAIVISPEKISRQSFIAIVNVDPVDPSSEINIPSKHLFRWKVHDEWDGESDVILVKNWRTMSAALHILADSLPDIGQYFVDILCSGDVFMNESPKQKVEISLSLERFEMWHNAHIVFQKPQTVTPEQATTLAEWSSWLHGSVSSAIWPFSDLKLWNGCLRLGEKKSFDGFELLYLGDYEHLLADVDTHGYLKKFLLSKEISHVDTSFCLLAEVLHTAIPLYFYTPLKFLLQIPEGSCTGTLSQSFVEVFERSHQYSMLFSLDFTCCGEMYDNERYKFESWASIFLSGKTPEVHPQADLPYDCPHFSFLVTYDSAICQPGRSLVAQLLVDPSDLDFSRILPKVLASDMPVTYDQSENFYDLIPKLDEELIPKQENWDKEHTETEQLASSQYVDPSDWPERRYLLLKELKRQKDFTSLFGLPPPTSNRKVIELKLSDFSKYFDLRGQPKRRSSSRKENLLSTLQVIVGGKGKFSLKVSKTYEEILKLSWPDWLQCHYHDIYLNHNSWKEEQEMACNRLKEQYVLEETLSSDPNSNKPWVLCVLPKNKQKTPQNGPKDFSQKQRRTKSSSYSSYSRSHATSPRKRRHSPRKLGDSVSSQLSKARHIQKPGTIRKSCPEIPRSQRLPELHREELTRASLPRSLEDSIRRSPRFKLSQSLHSTEVSLSKLKNTDDLSEKHKKKLREAVAVALESQGITLNNPSFKLCGRRLFNVCKAFVKDIVGKGSTSALMKEIASAHVKQVIEFEKIKSRRTT